MGLFGGRGKGLFGGGKVDVDKIMMAMQRAGALSQGEYGQAAQIHSLYQRQQAERQQAEAEAAQLQQMRQAASQLGISPERINALRPEELSALVLDMSKRAQFGPEGGSIYDPQRQGSDQWIRAPWQQQVGRSIIEGGPNGAPPQAVYEGVEPISVTQGGEVYGLKGSGSFVSPGDGAPSAEDLPSPRTPGEAAQLPPGTRFRAPDGRVKTVPMRGGASPSNGSGGFPGQWR